jgi:hypothetical protein
LSGGTSTAETAAATNEIRKTMFFLKKPYILEGILALSVFRPETACI